MISARLSEHSEKRYFTRYQWRKKKKNNLKAHLKGDVAVVVVHIMSDVAAAHLANRDDHTLRFKQKYDELIR